MTDVHTLAQRYEADQIVRCGWATGDNAAFAAWIESYWHDDDAARSAWHAHQAGTYRPAPDAVSECGGGSEAVYWYVDDDAAYGYPTAHAGRYGVPLDVEMPDIPGYQRLADEPGDVGNTADDIGSTIASKLGITLDMLSSLYTNVPVGGYSGRVVVDEIRARFALPDDPDEPLGLALYERGILTIAEAEWLDDIEPGDYAEDIAAP